MTVKKKHSKAEIAAKLVQADDLATQGMLQREIARTLGVSPMTLHRWRKIRPDATPEEVARFGSGSFSIAPGKEAHESIARSDTAELFHCP
jgi:transposase-like protein